MSDVTALVLSLGEPYTDRALASVRHQTVAVAETILVRDVAPFHAAFNHGVAQVRTPFLIQVDADMILDATCIASLRAVMTPAVGIVVGFLRDPLLGRIVGVKLCRTECFRETPFPESVSPDTDAVETLGARGWAAARALCWDSRHTFGRHEPDYTPSYTYAKFLVTGVRHHHRRNGEATRAFFRQLGRSTHPLAPLATAALAHGLFVEASGDLLDARRRWHLPPVIQEFDSAPASPATFRRRVRMGRTIASHPQSSVPFEAFSRGYHAGRASSAAGAGAVRSEHARLAAEWSVPAWVAAVGFFHGLLGGDEGPSEPARAFARLAPLLPIAERVEP